jgi:hypothetical protein
MGVRHVCGGCGVCNHPSNHAVRLEVLVGGVGCARPPKKIPLTFVFLCGTM